MGAIRGRMDPTTMSAAAATGTPGGRSVASVGIVALAALIQGLAVPAPAAAQFSAQPVILEMRTADTISVASFAVRNEGDAPLQLQIYAGDFDQPAGGGHEFLEAGSHARSCVARLQFYPDDLQLAPGESGEVRVLMEPGESTCWSMVFVQSASRSEGGMQIAQRIGIKVYGFSSRAVADAEIRSVTVSMASATGGLAALIDFDNLGDGPLRPQGEIEIRTELGAVVAVVPVAPFSVLPGRTRRTVVPLELDLAPGRYLAIPILDFGGDYLAGGQAAFEVGG